MLLSYDDFRSHFERLGVAEAEGLAQLEALEAMLDPFVIAGLEGKSLGIDDLSDSDPKPISVELKHTLDTLFNSAARDDAAGKKET